MRHAVALFLLGCVISTSAAQSRAPSPATWRVCFSPRGGCQGLIVDALDDAKRSVYVQAYSFTNARIAEALLRAHKRGVHVEVILDKSNATARYSAATFLENSGVPTTIDAAHAIAHSKVMVIDEAQVITGSYNFTAAAENSNAENMLILRDPKLARAYLDNWKVHRKHATPPVEPAEPR